MNYIELGNGAIVGASRQYWRALAGMVASDFVTANFPDAPAEYQSYVEDLVLDQISEAVGGVSVLPLRRWEEDRELSAAAELDNTRGLGV